MEIFTVRRGSWSTGEAKIYGYVKIYVLIFIQCNKHYIKGMGTILWKQGKVVGNSARWGTNLFWLHMDVNIGVGFKELLSNKTQESGQDQMGTYCTALANSEASSIQIRRWGQKRDYSAATTCPSAIRSHLSWNARLLAGLLASLLTLL